jgi:hypothetical protein
MENHIVVIENGGENTALHLHYQGNRSFYMGLASAEAQKLECFKWTAIYFFKSTIKVYWTH